MRALIQRLPRCREHLHEHGADLRREPSADDHHAVVILIHVQRPARVAPGGLLRFGLPVHPAPAAHDALDVVRGAGPADRE